MSVDFALQMKSTDANWLADTGPSNSDVTSDAERKVTRSRSGRL